MHKTGTEIKIDIFCIFKCTYFGHKTDIKL